MYERYTRNEFNDRPPEYPGADYDKQYSEMIFADMADADAVGKQASNSSCKNVLLFKKLEAVLLKLRRSVRPKLSGSRMDNDPPAPKG